MTLKFEFPTSIFIYHKIFFFFPPTTEICENHSLFSGHRKTSHKPNLAHGPLFANLWSILYRRERWSFWLQHIGGHLSFDDPIHSVLYKVVSKPSKQFSEANTIILLIIPYYTVSLLCYIIQIILYIILYRWYSIILCYIIHNIIIIMLYYTAEKFSVSWPKISNIYSTVW